MKEKVELWHIPLDEYFIRTGEFPMRSKFMELDGIGFLLEYDNNNPKKFDPDFIRHHLQGMRSSSTLIEAETIERAIEKFYMEYEGANIGTKRRALRISDVTRITAVVWCERRHKNRIGEYICGEPVADNPEEWVTDEDKESLSGTCGMCFLEGYDVPEYCPSLKVDEIDEEILDNLSGNLKHFIEKGKSKDYTISTVTKLLEKAKFGDW